MFRFMLLLVTVLTLIDPSLGRAQTFSAFDAVEQTSNGAINWTSGEVYAKGIGAPPAKAANPAQARAMAERAAFVVALRNLLETVKGVRVDSESVVENFMVKSDIIRTRVDGIVKGAQVVKKQYLSDGSVEVLVGMSMKGAFLSAVIPDRFGTTRPPSPGPSLISQKPSDIRPSRPVPQPAPVPQQPQVPEKKAEPFKPALAQPKPAPSAPDQKNEPLKPVPSTPLVGKTQDPVTPALPAPPVVPAPVPAPAPAKPAPPAAPEGNTEPTKPAPALPAPKEVPDSTVSFKGGVATGLVIDGRGLGLRPALLPRIVDQQGQEVYVGQVVTRTNAVEQGVAGYAKDVNAAANNFRVTDNPAVIKGLSTGGTTKTDIVIGQADAQLLRRMASQGDFLQYCRVIIVY